MVQADITTAQLKIKQDNGKAMVYDPIRKKWLVLTPEEHVRQYFVAYIVQVLRYPPALIAVERKILTGQMPRRFDIVVYNREHKPWMLVECKAPEVPISETTLHQLLHYHSNLQCQYWVLTNGHETFCADACNAEDIRWIDSLPAYNF